jgi:uncharacterized protein
VLKFDFNEGKSQSNKQKHGIDFVEAQKLWQGELLEFRSPAEGEMRYLEIGMIGSDYWSAIVTFRGSAIRLIRQGLPRY